LGVEKEVTLGKQANEIWGINTREDKNEVILNGIV
jgi:hypothetical protein